MSVAVSRAREDAIIYTNSIEELRGALDRRVDKEMALEATKDTVNQRQTQGEESTQKAFLNREDCDLNKSLEESALDGYAQAQGTQQVAQVEEIEFEFSL